MDDLVWRKARVISTIGSAVRVEWIIESAEGGVRICGPQVQNVDAALVPPELRLPNTVFEVGFLDCWTPSRVRPVTPPADATEQQ